MRQTHRRSVNCIPNASKLENVTMAASGRRDSEHVRFYPRNDLPFREVAPPLKRERADKLAAVAAAFFINFALIGGRSKQINLAFIDWKFPSVHKIRRKLSAVMFALATIYEHPRTTKGQSRRQRCTRPPLLITIRNFRCCFIHLDCKFIGGVDGKF